MNFKQIKEDVLDIINSKTKIVEKENIPELDDSTFTYGDGVKTWVGAIFVDIRDSSKLFKDYNEDKLARMLRAFSNEIIKILKSIDCYRQIGIRGDCVYGIYNVPKKDNIYNMFDLAIKINTFLKFYNTILSENQYETIKAGIGVGCGKDLVIKVGLKQSGINDMIWIGDAVVDASKLSGLALKETESPILFSKCVYENIKDIYRKISHKYDEWFERNEELECYECDLYKSDYDDYAE